jgi:cell division protein FtsZ
MVLATDEPKSPITTIALPVDEREVEEIAEEPLVKEQPIGKPMMKIVKEEKMDEAKDSLQPILIDFDIVMGMQEDVVSTIGADSKNTGDNLVDKNEPIEKFELVYSLKSDPPEAQSTFPTQRNNQTIVENNSSASAVSGGYLAKPSNIYAESRLEPVSGIEQTGPLNEPVSKPVEQQPSVQKEEEPSFDMQLVMKDEPKMAADESRAPQSQEIASQSFTAEEPALRDEAEEQRQRAAERIQKLRNLSFNINAADPNNEFETVPAYIRRNLELYNTVNNVENFYSNYTVKTDENNNTQISTINTFLDGEKPD